MQYDRRPSNLGEKGANTARRRSCGGLPVSENRSENVRPRRLSVGDEASCEQLPRPWSRMLGQRSQAALGSMPTTNLAVSQSVGNIRLSTGLPAAHATPEDATQARMQREMKNPRLVLLDCPLECKKTENQDEDWESALHQEEEEMRKVCEEIIQVKPDLVITERGVSDLAQHFLLKANVSVICHVSKTDNNRIARIAGAAICYCTEELAESAVGKKCGAFSVKKIGDEYFAFFTAEDPKSCSIVLRGAAKDLRDSVMDSTHSAIPSSNNILKPKLMQSGSNKMVAASQPKEKEQQGASKDTVIMNLREEQIRLREANVALKEMQLANRQELESIERARQLAAEELTQLQKRCEAEQVRLDTYKRQQTVLCDKLKCCRAVVTRTVGCIDRLYEQQGREMRHCEQHEDSLVAEAEAVDAEAAQMLEILEDETMLSVEGDE